VHAAVSGVYVITVWMGTLLQRQPTETLENLALTAKEKHE